MKTISRFLIFPAFLLIFFGCSSSSDTSDSVNENQNSSDSSTDHIPQSSDESRELVVYFSATGNTREAAEKIAELTGAELFELQAAQPYSSEDLDYNDSDSRTSLEQNDENSRPEIQSLPENTEDYDVIYVGFPIWWNDLPRIYSTFFEDMDFTDQVIAPFATSGGSSISKAEARIRDLEPGAIIAEGFLANGASDQDYETWINSVN